MQCPVCKNVALSMTERQGVEIDYCPQCRGVWLDRGELDKLIERSEPALRGEYRDERPRQYYDRDYHDYEHRRRKRRSFLGDLFDFD